MSRNGVGRIALFWTMRIVPPCSTTNKRRVPSFRVCIPTGALKPEMDDTRVIFTLEGCAGVDDELPPQAHMMHKAKAAMQALDLSRRAIFMAIRNADSRI